MSRSLRTFAIAVLATGVAVDQVAGQSDSEFLRERILDQLRWRNVGPVNFGGRVVDFAVDPRRSSTFYVATATGGLWKTRNNGTTFQSIFDQTAALSIGDIALAPSNPDVVYVATGEANNQRSSYWGNGVYRSDDGGTTFRHLGLDRTEHIGRIVVHPTDPDRVWVAALGALYTASPDRGLYRTTDGGKTWKCVKSIDDDVGFVDVAIDPSNPDVVFAASYERRRRAHHFDGAGPGSAIWKSTDGGDQWDKLGGGLPTGEIGRIGLAVFPGNSKVVYALIENANPRTSRSRSSSSDSDDARRPERRDPAPGAPQNRRRTVGGELYRSDDGGETWKKRNRRAVGGSPHYYYGQVRVSPTDDQRLYVLGVRVSTSGDGGKTWKSIARNLHSDHHALWIDPTNPDRILLGNDGGPALSHDGGATWDYFNNLPLGQFYAVGVDNRDPYWIYGGTQDNGTWGTPTRAPSRRGLRKRHAARVSGGDGFYACVDPEDPNVIYSESQFGMLLRTNLATGAVKRIRPRANAAAPSCGSTGCLRS